VIGICISALHRVEWLNIHGFQRLKTFHDLTLLVGKGFASLFLFLFGDNLSLSLCQYFNLRVLLLNHSSRLDLVLLLLLGSHNYLISLYSFSHIKLGCLLLLLEQLLHLVAQWSLRIDQKLDSILKINLLAHLIWNMIFFMTLILFVFFSFFHLLEALFTFLFHLWLAVCGIIIIMISNTVKLNVMKRYLWSLILLLNTIRNLFLWLIRLALRLRVVLEPLVELIDLFCWVSTYFVIIRMKLVADVGIVNIGKVLYLWNDIT